MTDPLELLRHYMPLFEAEYLRIGIAEEMERYFTGSGGVDLTTDLFERELERLRAVPNAIGFSAYCTLAGIDIDALTSGL